MISHRYQHQVIPPHFDGHHEVILPHFDGQLLKPSHFRVMLRVSKTPFWLKRPKRVSMSSKSQKFMVSSWVPKKYHIVFSCEHSMGKRIWKSHSITILKSFVFEISNVMIIFVVLLCIWLYFLSWFLTFWLLNFSKRTTYEH